MKRKIIITVLSPIPKKENVQFFQYVNDSGTEIEADWTNQAGLQYLLRTVPDCTDIISMCSEKTNDKQHHDRITKIVKTECGENINLVFIGYSTDDHLNDITNTLTHEFRFESSDILYFDTTGGLRSVTYSLVYLFRYFEYMGIKIKKAVYSSLVGGKGKIEDISDTFRMFSLINGTHEFTSTGNPRTLQKFFADTDNEKIKRLLESMNNFYDSITLCRIGDELEQAVSYMNEEFKQLENSSPKNYNESLFVGLIPVIREKFNADGKMSYLSLTKWCLKNDLLQQAITLYVEKLPKAYFNELAFLGADFDNLEKKTANPGTEIYQDYLITSPLKEFNKKFAEIVSSRKQVILKPKNQRQPLLLKEDEKYETVYNMLLKFRDTFYDNYGKKYYDMPTGGAARKLLEKTYIQFDKIPKTVDGLVNNANMFISLLQNTKNNTKSGTSTYANNLSGVLQGLVDDNVTVNISADELKQIRLDYIYMKYVRNQVNHASETNKDDEYFKERLSIEDPERYRFPEGNHFTADMIREFLIQSVKYIDKVSSHE